MNCRVCGSQLDRPIFTSKSDRSLTSLTLEQLQPTVVYWCDRCGHVQTPPMDNLDEFYDRVYKFMLDSEEEDQLYKVIDGKKIFRAEFQAQTLIDKLELTTGARVLDYGCGKGGTDRRLLALRPDIALHFFDVTDMYVDYWSRLVPEQHFATYDVPEEWRDSFDAVTSYFVLEHVEEPVSFTKSVAELVKPGGAVYFIVPNLHKNTADFIVVDHVNHFTRPSIEWLLHACGLVVEELDDTTHDGAWIVTARRPVDVASVPETPNGGASEQTKIEELAQYWTKVFETLDGIGAHLTARNANVAVYGASFYGTLAAVNLPLSVDIVAFIDQNPYLQGREHLGRPVVAPADLDASVTDVVVGLNPRVARSIIGDIEAFKGRDLTFHYLGG